MLCNYVWKDNTTERRIVIMNHIDDYRTPPTIEQAVEQGFTEEEAKAADWTKIVGTTNVQTFGQKGYW